MEKTIQTILDNFFHSGKHQEFKKGEILIRADDNPTGVYYLTSGKVKMYVISKTGEEVIMTIFKPGSFFPMSWAINGTPNRFYFEAMDDVEVQKAGKDEVLTFLKSQPEITYDLLQRLYLGVDGLLIRMANLMAGSAYIRLLNEISIASQRFGQKSEQGLTLHISEGDLAKLTGLTRETVSREMRTLKAKGIVQFAKNILTILDSSKLQEELGEF